MNYKDRENALDRYLKSALVTRLTGKVAQQHLERIWHEARLERDERTLDELHPARIFVCWRLTRGLMDALDMLTDDETLPQAMERFEKPWHGMQRSVLTHREETQGFKRIDQMSIRQLAGVDKGLALIPLGLKEHDARFVQAMKHVAPKLHLNASVIGQDGLRGLFDDPVGLWAQPEEMLSFEEDLVTEALQLLVQHGEQGILKLFIEKHGLSHKEARMLVRLCRAKAAVEFTGDVEEDRALLAASWKSLIARAQDNMDPDLEMKALKELGKVLGVTRTEPTDNLTDMVQTVKRHNKELKESDVTKEHDQENRR